MGRPYMRICYKHGVVKEEDKLFEFHKRCDCAGCKGKYMGRTRANQITVIAEYEEEIAKVERFLENWKCSDERKDLPEVYLRASQI